MYPEHLADFYEQSFGKQIKVSEITVVLEELYFEDSIAEIEELEANREIPSFIYNQ